MGYHDKNGKFKSRTIYLHRFITNAGKKTVVDHLDSKATLDNRKANLRITNHRVNGKNRDGANKNSRTGVRNVNYIENANQYWVQFCINYEQFKWTFPADQFKEACEFANKKRVELYGTKKELHIKDEELFSSEHYY